MNFLSPAWLWTLGLLLPLAAVFFLKVRPRRKATNAFFLWEKVLADRQSSALFRRLRDVISLILMLVAAAFIALALGRPQLRQQDERDVLVVIDSSVSMRAGSPTAFSVAVAEAEGIVRAMNGSRRVAIASIDSQVSFASNLSDSPKDLMDALQLMQPSSFSLDASALAGLSAYTPAEGDSGHRVIFITDGTGVMEALPAGIDVIRVDLGEGNVGITAADMRWLPGQPEAPTVFVKLASSYEKSRKIELELRHQDTGLVARLVELEVEPGESEGIVFELDDVEHGAWRISLLEEDSLSEDNSVLMGLNPLRPIPVQVEADDPYFFQRCIEAFALGGNVLRPGGGPEAMTVAVGRVPATGDCLVFAPQGEGEFWSETGELIPVALATAVAKDHPVISHIDLTALPFAGARELEMPPGATLIASSESSLPLIYQVQEKGRSVIVLNFDPAASDFFLSPWFPVIIYDAALHLSGRGDELPAVSRLGRSFALPAGASTTELPDGAEASGNKIRLTQSGLYQTKVGEQLWLYGAAVLDPAESLLAGTSELPEPEALASGNPLGVWLLTLALIILSAEVILYHRRKAG